MKYNHDDVRNVLERASARETTARVAVGALAKQLLAPFGVRVMAWVAEIGGIASIVISVRSSSAAATVQAAAPAKSVFAADRPSSPSLGCSPHPPGSPRPL